MNGTMRMKQMSKPLPAHKVKPNEDLSDLGYYTKYLKGLEDFLYKESLSLTTSEYFRLAEEIERMKEYIGQLEML